MLDPEAVWKESCGYDTWCLSDNRDTFFENQLEQDGLLKREYEGLLI